MKKENGAIGKYIPDSPAFNSYYFRNNSSTMARIFQIEPQICHASTARITTESTVAKIVIIIYPLILCLLPDTVPGFDIKQMCFLLTDL